MDKKSKEAEWSGMLVEERVKWKQPWITREKLIVFLLLFVGVILIIVGIVLLAVASKRNECSTDEPPTPSVEPTSQPSQAQCAFSDEANRVRLKEFIKQVKYFYYELHPFNIPFDPDVDVQTIRRQYSAYDPSPLAIKNRTDTSWELLKKINDARINENALRPRERRALSQVKHYLAHVFGQPYDVNYYAGDWMMGPNLFCWQPICYHGHDVYNGLGLHHKPFDAADVELIESKLKTHKDGILQYIENMKMGVRKGMVRSKEECVAGLDSIKRKYLNISLFNETGVWKEWFVRPILDPEFYSNITENVDATWKEKRGKNVSDTVKDYLLTYLGKPIHELLRFLEEDYSHYCVPSNTSSGLAGLPLRYVWYDGKENRSMPTDPMLLTGEKLNGTYSYSLIMPYFTTNKMSPKDVHDLGKKQLSVLFPEVVKIAREVTGEKDNKTAIRLFRKKLNSSESFFNAAPIPKNESDKEAHRKCSNLADAEKYCPARWAAMQLWFQEARKAMSMLDPKTVNMFYFTGPKHTAPNCPVDLKPDLNPSSGAQSYDGSDAACSRNAIYNIPFFLENLGPRFSEWSVNAHEARPGHHTQVQGTTEHFRDSCKDELSWLDSETYYTAFTEGWALYGENPLIAEDTDTYKNEPMQRFGMLKWQLWRAIRLIVDTGLHYVGFTRDDALWYFDEYAWDGTDLAKKEVTRYQSDPGQATAYMIGQLDLKKARKYAEDNLGEKFSLRDFHYQVLVQGSSPLAYLSDHVTKYVACVKQANKEGCKEILTPPKKVESKKKSTDVRWPLVPKPHRHYI